MPYNVAQYAFCDMGGGFRVRFRTKNRDLTPPHRLKIRLNVYNYVYGADEAYRYHR